jgi:hypothetical protein
VARIVWLNGPFGVGKTSVARALAERWPEARIVDPERIGYVMRRTFWRGRDYQDVELWRRLTVRWIARVARGRPVIVPMTVVDPAVYAQITAGATVVALTAPRSVLLERIDASGEAVAWRRQQLDRGLAAMASGEFGVPVGTEGRSPVEVAALVASMVPEFS